MGGGGEQRLKPSLGVSLRDTARLPSQAPERHDVDEDEGAVLASAQADARRPKAAPSDGFSR